MSHASRVATTLTCAALLAAAALPGRAAADRRVSSERTASKLDAFAGALVWSRWVSPRRHQLALVRDGIVTALPIVSTRPLEADLGPTLDGSLEVVYTRCTRGTCSAFAYSLASGQERPLTVVSSPCRIDAIATWMGTIAYATTGRDRCAHHGIYLRDPGGAVRLMRRRIGYGVTGLDLGPSVILWTGSRPSTYNSQTAVSLTTT